MIVFVFCQNIHLLTFLLESLKNYCDYKTIIQSWNIKFGRSWYDWTEESYQFFCSCLLKSWFLEYDLFLFGSLFIYSWFVISANVSGYILSVGGYDGFLWVIVGTWLTFWSIFGFGCGCIFLFLGEWFLLSIFPSMSCIFSIWFGNGRLMWLSAKRIFFEIIFHHLSFFFESHHD